MIPQYSLIRPRFNCLIHFYKRPISLIVNMATERTFIMIKPDGVHRGIVGGSVEHLEKHYADLSKKPFFAGLVKYMVSGPVVAMVWEGLNAVKTGRVMLGETNPADSKPGTIRGDFAVQVREFSSRS